MAELAEGLHSVSAIVFLVLLPLPLLIRRLVRNNNQSQAVPTLRTWKIILILAHVFLIVSFISGLLMGYSADPSFRWLVSFWFISVMVIFVALGAFLGMTLKSVRLAIMDSGQPDQTVLLKLQRQSRLLSLTIIGIFILMFVSPFMH